MPREKIPPAPAIGGDAYEVAEWLRKVREKWASCIEETVIVGEMIDAFETANPETKR